MRKSEGHLSQQFVGPSIYLPQQYINYAKLKGKELGVVFHYKSESSLGEDTGSKGRGREAGEEEDACPVLVHWSPAFQALILNRACATLPYKVF